jgi:hypothetical protein
LKIATNVNAKASSLIGIFDKRTIKINDANASIKTISDRYSNILTPLN